jgi:TolA-binding protein
MQKAWFLLSLLLGATAPVLADGGPEQAAASGTQAPARARLKRQVQAHDAQVTQLQQAVSEQERHSRQASRRLAAQDQEIARLQRELEALRDHRQGGDPGH